MQNPEASNIERILVVFETRSDGGLRVYSDDVPGFILSHSDATAVLSDVLPALETIVGEMMGSRVKITPADEGRSLSWFPSERKTISYEARRIA